jgi:hypothetical protein
LSQFLLLNLADQSIVFLSLFRDMWQFLKSYIEKYVSHLKKDKIMV